ncbi:glucose-6-phosphate isomerase [Nonomuraea cavernae]|uniref:Glucose-6-phosphate isomerase n=1 Tax=Nonomuraea cavernae TaxID=2045107 RepID=A0A918DN42_9ACTN|nr:glucose-6-phosphate isomerase [Nonomuraea cavernae]MCA2189088.1 glucose-6-phosphate isomerase [Nonomuraea cavernae]GGO76127.1 glucose-6-phosphate isomerase [Nonomuraea cavernae]
MEVTYRDQEVADSAASVAERLVAEGVPARLAGGDPTLWGEDAAPVAAARLGWLALPRASRGLLPELAALARRARADGLTNVVLAGLGGSSPAAEVICASADAPLTVLDTTDPGQVRRALAEGLDSTILVVAGTSGASVETEALLRVYERAFLDAGIDPATRVTVVADPGSPLERPAAESGYHLIPAAPGVGGRYSALSAFGLVPSALAGADAGRLLDEAAEVLPLLSKDTGNPGLDLGAALGGAALAGRDKLLMDDRLSAATGLPDWIEQLVAGSTGKRGRGILPVVGGEPRGTGDELLVAFDADDGDVRVDGPLGAQFLVWQYATAVAGLVLGVDPFDEPNIAESTAATGRLLTLPALPVGEPVLVDGPVEVYGHTRAKDLPGVLTELLRSVPDGGYVAVTAYLDRLAAFDAPVAEGADFEQMTDAWMAADAATLRPLLALRTDRPVTFGWGPRFARSTGQYHRGGPQNGVFLQVTGAVADDVAVPGRPYTLGTLQLAQALGDLDALEHRGRPAVRVHLTDRAAGVAHLLAAAQEA